MIRTSKAFSEGFPLIFTSFVNKCGQLGLTFLPVLILEKGIPVSDGSLILGTIKAAAFIGTYYGGWSSDNLGLRNTILISFLGCAVGFGLLPLFPSMAGIMILGVIAQAGHAMFPSAARMMLTSLHGKERLQEGVAWLRMANNAGQIVSYGFGAIFAALGTVAFFYLDSITSVMAAVTGIFLLPKQGRLKQEVLTGDTVSVLQVLNPKNLRMPAVRMFLHCSFIIGVYSLIYEIILIGVASKSKILYGTDGIRLFSQFMIVNCILCTIFAVPAATYFKNAKKTFMWGLLISGVGGAVCLHASPTKSDLFLGSFFMTFGEIIFSSTAQFTLINLVPNSKKKGSLYSLSIIIQKIGIVIAGIVALPLAVTGGYASVAVGILTVAVLALTWAFPFKKL